MFAYHKSGMLPVENNAPLERLVLSTQPHATVSIVMSTRKRRTTKVADEDFDFDFEAELEEEEAPSEAGRPKRTRGHASNAICRSASTPAAMASRTGQVAAAAAARPVMRRSSSSNGILRTSNSSVFK